MLSGIDMEHEFVSISLMFGPSTLYMTVGKCEEDSFNSFSLNLPLLSVSSSLSV